MVRVARWVDGPGSRPWAEKALGTSRGPRRPVGWCASWAVKAQGTRAEKARAWLKKCCRPENVIARGGVMQMMTASGGVTQMMTPTERHPEAE